MTHLVRMLGLATTIEAPASIFVEECEFDEVTERLSLWAEYDPDKRIVNNILP